MPSVELREYTGHRERHPDTTFRSFLLYEPGTPDTPDKPQHHLGVYFKYPDNQTHGFVWHGAINIARFGQFFEGLSDVVTRTSNLPSSGRTVESILQIEYEDIRTLHLEVEEDLATYRRWLTTPLAVMFARWDVKNLASTHKKNLEFGLTVDNPAYDSSEKRPAEVTLALSETTPFTPEMIDYIRTHAVSEASPKIDPAEAVVVFQAAA